MSTRSLLCWIAGVAGAELAIRGHLAGHGAACHGGALLLAAALLVASRGGASRAARLGRATAAGLAALAGLDALAALDPGRALLAPPGPGSAGAASETPAPASSAQLGEWLRELGCGERVALIDVAQKRSSWEESLAARPELALLRGGAALEGILLAESPGLSVPSAALPAARASPLGAAIESAWRRARSRRALERARGQATEVDARSSRVAGRYRSALLLAREGGARAALLLPGAEVGAPELAPARAAHARLARAVAGSYAARALKEPQGSEALARLLRELGAPCSLERGDS